MTSHIAPPGKLRSASDVPRAWLEASTVALNWWWLRLLPEGDGHPVMVIPGFAGSDTYNQPLIRFLRSQGYHAVGWKQGVNLGHSHLDMRQLETRIDKLHRRENRKISLIGHSLGGIIAREAARQHPDRIRQVISLGSPIGKERDSASKLNHLYRQVNNQPGELNERDWHIAPPVPTTAIYSRHDGVLDWRVCLQSDGHSQSENVEVIGSHNGLTVNAMSWMIIAERLSAAEDNWQPFRKHRLLRWLYRKPAWQPVTKSTPTADGI